MANVWEKAKAISTGNLNSGLSDLITAVSTVYFKEIFTKYSNV